jgi:hypothetical protein
MLSIVARPYLNGRVSLTFTENRYAALPNLAALSLLVKVFFTNPAFLKSFRPQEVNKPKKSAIQKSDISHHLLFCEIKVI